MTYILCLAHYCDTHGPTPLMVTEGLPTPCTTCFEDASITGATSHPGTPAAGVTSALSDLDLSRNVPVPRRTSHRRTADVPTSAVDTPPGSPRTVYQQSRVDSNFRRTYDETVTKKQGPCDNCAMTLPRRSVAASSVDAGANNKGPTLRTRAPAERVFGASGQASPPNSQTSSDTDGEKEAPRRTRNRRVLPSSSRTTSCSSNSTTSEQAPFHVHYVDYTSTHEPALPASFSLVRASCLRTLSFETLPRPPTTASPTTSPQSAVPPSFVTTQSAGSAGAGGPIFFGDQEAGFTTAYIFRIPDVHARGHKRVYAFMALSTHKERLAMKTFATISGHFRDFATWIQQMAEAEAERAAESSPISGNFYSGAGLPPPAQSTSAFGTAAVDRSASSFLSGGGGFSRRMGGAGAASAPKARGLAELVGQPDFFIELHRKFVQLLFEVGVTLNS